VVGTIKLVGTHRQPEPSLAALPTVTGVMGQRLMNPPTVEGWHTGKEWIDGGTLNERINFAVNEVSDAAKRGVRAIVDRLSVAGAPLAPEAFVEACLDLVGPLRVGETTRGALLAYAQSGGELRFGTTEERGESTARVVRMLQLIVASPEYQLE
jgi:hypothetical protein